ncbi:hypothetical protein PoMZ_05424, partial [Pyricularia oryzae]
TYLVFVQYHTFYNIGQFSSQQRYDEFDKSSRPLNHHLVPTTGNSRIAGLSHTL